MSKKTEDDPTKCEPARKRRATPPKNPLDERSTGRVSSHVMWLGDVVERELAKIARERKTTREELIRVGMRHLVSVWLFEEGPQWPPKTPDEPGKVINLFEKPVDRSCLK